MRKVEEGEKMKIKVFKLNKQNDDNSHNLSGKDINLSLVLKLIIILFPIKYINSLLCFFATVFVALQ